jgi:trans-aconitate methyltransferase
VARDLSRLERKVLGFDLSFTMCAAAASHPDRSNVVQADAATLPLADNTVDCAVAFMSLQDMDDVTGAVNEIVRVFKDGASLAMAIVHPMYSAGKFATPGDNVKNSFVMKRTYFQHEVLVSTDSHGDRSVTLFRKHLPLQTYMNALIKAGFHVEELLELPRRPARKGRGRHIRRVPISQPPRSSVGRSSALGLVPSLLTIVSQLRLERSL